MPNVARRLMLLALATAVATPATLSLPAAATTTVTTVRTVARHVGVAALNPGEPRTLVLRGPVRDVALHWKGSPKAAVTIRLSQDGASFGPPVSAGRDEVGEHRGDGRSYGALLGADGAVAIEVSTDRQLVDLDVVSLADGASVTRTVSRPVSASAAASQPAVLARAQWGADETLRFDSTGKEIFPPAFYATKKLIVHHTAGRNDDPDPAATIRSIYYYHAVTQGWGDIGYNFLVDESGRIYEGRHSRDYPPGVLPSGDDAGGNGVTGAHTSGWNSGTVGVALLGTLTDRDATPAARDALTSVLAWESQKNGLDPTATSTFVNPVSGASRTTPNIAGHRDYAATECPGGVFYSTLPALRTAVSNNVAGTTPPPPPAADTTPPTVPSAVTATTGTRAVTVSWSASTDNVGVASYTVQRSTKSATSNYTQVASVTATTWTNSGLSSGKRYWYRVRASDAAGNASAWSAVVSAIAG